jgi:D-alanyl-D-alanine carboxypeptidase
MKRSYLLTNIFAFILILVVLSIPASSQSMLAPALQQKIDSIVTGVLTKSGLPSASIAVVQDDRIVYAKAYGLARLEPKLAASTDMRYCIGSISKQFTSAAILFLQREGKLSLDDNVSRFLPDLTRANEVTIRELLSHTSGYQDFWPQDYVMPFILKPITAEQILERWAKKPLDFDPGTQWQYSNTNYVIAGMIVERVSGIPIFRFLGQNVFTPLGMKSVVDIDAPVDTSNGVTGYFRVALGPLRPAPKEGRGWMFAAGELTMTPTDLALWDISLINEQLLGHSSYDDLEREVLLKNGLGTHYGLGVNVGSRSGHRYVSHSGEVSGFTAQNVVFPDDSAAVVVLTNQDASPAAGAIMWGIAPLLLEKNDATTPQRTELARKIFEGLQHSTIDRSLFTEDANFYFNEQALNDCQESLGRLGEPKEFVQVGESLRGGMKERVYRVQFEKKSLRVWTYEMPDGLLEQYQIAEQN